MWGKLKHVLPLVLAILLAMSPTAAAQDIWIPETEPTKAPDDYSDYETVVVTRGSVLYDQRSSSASTYYPNSQDVLCEYSGVRLQEFLVSKGDTVKKGDIIAYLYRPCNQTDLARMELNLQRAEETMQEGISQREENIKQLQAQAAGETDVREQEILRLTIEYQKTELALYRYNQQKAIVSQKESLALYEPIPVTAPMDGTIYTLNAAPEDELSKGDKLLVLRNESIQYLRLNSSTDFVYNLPLTVTATVKGEGDQEDTVHTLTGRIIAASNVIPSSLLNTAYGDVAYLLLDPGQSVENASNYHISGSLRQLDDVLILPEGAFLNRTSHTAYVQVLLPDGSSEQRLVTLGISDAFYSYFSVTGITRYFWVVDGLSEGDTVILWE